MKIYVGLLLRMRLVLWLEVRLWVREGVREGRGSCGG